MRSIEARYKIMCEKYPFHSSFVCFEKAVEGQHFSKSSLSSAFRKNVEKDDYDKADWAELRSWLFCITEDDKIEAEEPRFQPENAQIGLSMPKYVR